MEKIRLAEVQDLVAWEKARTDARARIIALKKDRRLTVGPNLSLLFENRATVLFQIQEMVRTERIVDERRIQDEVDVYNALIPAPGELSATLFIEIPDLARLGPERVRETVNRFQGLDRDAVLLAVGSHRIPARWEAGRSSEEKMAAVHYVRFLVPEAVGAALADSASPARVLVEHKHYRAQADVTAALRKQLLEDLRPATPPL
jgi:hypothetical protein